MSERVRARCRDRIVRMCEASPALGVDALRLEVVEELRVAIGFASWGWPLADPSSLLATTGIADRAMWPVVPRLVDFEERHVDVNKDRELATSGNPVGVLSLATKNDVVQSARFREILRPHGFGDEIRAACVDALGCWAHLRLYRDRGDRSFSAEDAALLRAVVPAIASALRKSTAVATPADVASLEPLMPGVVILDEHLAVRSWTSDAGSWFGAFAGDTPPRGPNARCAVFSAAARCLAGTTPGLREVVPRARVRLPDGRWVVTEAARLEGDSRGVVVAVRPAATGDVLDLLVRAHGLTARERELVALIVNGLDTRDIAKRLFISPHTVQQHLKSVFDKVGVRSRRELVTGVFARPA